VYQTLQAFMGGVFVNYFNRFGRVCRYTSRPRASSAPRRNVGQFRVRNSDGQPVPLSTLVKMQTTYGPELPSASTVQAAQINGILAPGIARARE